MIDGFTARATITGRVVPIATDPESVAMGVGMVLADRPLSPEMTAAALSARLVRLQHLDDTLSALAGEAHDLGLWASSQRIEGVVDDVMAAVTAVRDALSPEAS